MRRRQWDAAGTNRLTAGWLSTLANPSDELRTALPVLRARSRNLRRNNEYARRFIAAVGTNIAGPHGVALQSRVGAAGGSRAADIDRRVEAAWRRWCQAGVCTLDGKLSFARWLARCVETAAVDGDSLTGFVRGPAALNPFGFALQSIDTDRLEETRVSREPLVFMGIEHDASGRALAYWLRTDDSPGILGGVSTRTERVPAERILQVFLPERSLLRGVPWMAPVMMRLNMLGGYQEAEVVAARLAASKMGFYTRSPESGDLDPDDTDAQGRPITEVEPGTFEQLPAGWDVKAFDSEHPTTAYQSFVTTCLQGISAGLGVSYHALTGDLSQANYSSLREAKLIESDAWRALQQWLIDAACRPVFARWLEMAITTGELAVSMGDYQRIIDSAQWQPRGWAWVDPEKEMAAYEKALALNLVTRSEILAAQGRDFEETLEQIAREQALMAEILMQTEQVVETMRGLIDKVESRHESFRGSTAESIAGLRADLAGARRALDAVPERIDELRQRIVAHQEQIDGLRSDAGVLRVSVDERLVRIGASVDGLSDRVSAAEAAARGAQRVADRCASQLAEKRAEWIGACLRRSVRIEAVGEMQARGSEMPRKLDVRFSSEEPVERWFGVEVLDHSRGAADLEFVGSGRAPLLFNHNPDRIIGRVVDARITQERVGRATIELPDGDADAEWALQKIRAGMLTNVSFGYLIQKAEERTDESGSKVVRVTRWQPLEISLVAVPADTTAGLGRSIGDDKDDVSTGD